MITLNEEVNYEIVLKKILYWIRGMVRMSEITVKRWKIKWK